MAHVEEPALEPSSGQSGRSWKQTDMCGCGIRPRTALWIMFTTQEQIPWDPERGPDNYGDISGKFD